MEVVIVFREAPPGDVAGAVPISDRVRLLVCLLAIGDVMNVAWMLSAGNWLDGSSQLSAVVTIGGHHLLVLWLAVAGFVTLALPAVLTGALTVVRRIYVPFIVLGAIVSAAAMSGVLSVVLLIVGAVSLLALLGGAFFGGRFVFLSGLSGLFGRRRSSRRRRR